MNLSEGHFHLRSSEAGRAELSTLRSSSATEDGLLGPDAQFTPKAFGAGRVPTRFMVPMPVNMSESSILGAHSSGPRSRRAAFTLTELLIVISVIAILASMTIPLSSVITKKRRFNVAQAELGQMQTAIEAYRAKLGFYPPDNPGNPVLNPLFFELKGTMATNTGLAAAYVTLDGSSAITTAQLTVLFGGVRGFMNCSKTIRGGDEATAAINFLKTGLRPIQIGKLIVDPNSKEIIDAILVCSIPWANKGDPPISSPPAATQPPFLNPWRYVSSNPTNNAASYDLWVDIAIKGKVYRISNWSRQPQLLY
jgi:prepilin-type N-terminal cleavage/methylation domain-containing protein